MATEKRLIDANAEIATIKENICKNCNSYDGVRCRACWVDDAIRFLEDAPTVDAVEVPCRMGDEVWGLKDYYGRKIPKLGVVNQMYFGEDMQLCICVKNVCRGEWGKNVFATKEEAEAAIERRTDNDV